MGKERWVVGASILRDVYGVYKKRDGEEIGNIMDVSGLSKKEAKEWARKLNSGKYRLSFFSGELKKVV